MERTHCTNGHIIGDNEQCSAVKWLFQPFLHSIVSVFYAVVIRANNFNGIDSEILECFYISLASKLRYRRILRACVECSDLPVAVFQEILDSTLCFKLVHYRYR